jgi:hypothetical protein
MVFKGYCMKKARIIIALVFLCMAACSAADAIDIRGKVTNVTYGQDTVVILVEGSVEKDTSLDKASVTVDSETVVVIRKNGVDTRADKNDIKLGDTVEVVFKGAVAESYPVQGGAKKVIILSEAD